MSKKMMVIDDDIQAGLDRLLAIDFWEAEYIKRKFFLENRENFDLFKKSIDLMYSIQFPEYGEDTLRYAMNAMLRREYES